MRVLCPMLMALLCSAVVLADDPPVLPPLPSELPVLAPLPDETLRARTRIQVPAPQAQRPIVRFPVTTNRALARADYTPPATVGDDILKWDATNKEHTVEPGEYSAKFTFTVTNVSPQEVVINWVRPSCGCTAAKLPPTPWTILPGNGGELEFDVDVRGKHGVLSKYISIDTSRGQKMLGIRVNIPVANTAGTPGMDSRTRNMQLAMADRQIVFRGECASCHATPAIGKTTGEAIYNAACAICHDAPHRATMVPDLRALQVPTSKEYWAFWTTHGKEGTLMPAFSKTRGGPLTDEQIQTLAEYLAQNFPSGPAPASATADSGGRAAAPSVQPAAH